jgi:hypothetical protein
MKTTLSSFTMEMEERETTPFDGSIGIHLKSSSFLAILTFVFCVRNLIASEEGSKFLWNLGGEEPSHGNQAIANGWE